MSTTATRITSSSADLVRHRPAGERGEQVVDGELGHPLAGGVRRRADVRARRSGSGRSSSGSSRGSGSGSVTSSAAPAICAVASACAQRLLVDDRPARGVDQDRGAAHLRERCGVDQVAGLGSQRAVQRDEVGRSSSGISASRSRSRALAWITVISKPRALAGDRAADPPQADDPERRAVDLGAEVAPGLPGAPVARRGRRSIASGSLRAAASSSANARSAVASVSTSGVLPTGMPRARGGARGRCCRSRPRSWRSRAAAEQRRAARRRRGRSAATAGPRRRPRALGSSSGVGGSRPGQTSTSCAARSRSSAVPGSSRVTKQRATARRFLRFGGLRRATGTVAV